MLLENNTKKVIDLIKMYDELRNTDKLKLVINILENKLFNINLEVGNIITQLKEILNNLDPNYMRTITNFSKYNYLLFFFIIKISPFLIFYHGKIFYLHKFIYRLN